MPSYSWWQAIQVLAGREPGTGGVSGITDGPPYLEIAPEAVLALLADGCAVVLGVPFDGQVHQPIPADAWRQIRVQLRSGPPFAVGEEPFGVVAVLRAGQGGGKSAGGGWHHLVITGPELAKLKATAERLTSSRTSPEVGEHQGTAADGPAIPLAVAAARIAAANPAESAAELLARLERTAARGNLRTAPAPGAEAPSGGSAADLALWCRRRALACPEGWGPAPPAEDDPVPTERDPDPWITPLEAAEWLTYRARDATEDLEAAVTGKLLPALRAGRLTAAGREGCAGPHREIPPVRWAKAELDVLAAEGGRLWLRHEPRRGPLWDQVLFPRAAVLELWPAREADGDAGLGGEAVYRSGLPGQPSSIHLVEAELDRRVAAGQVWESKALGGEELAAWLRQAHPSAPRAAAKTIVNRLRGKIPTARN